MIIALTLILAYLIGSIPFGLFFAKLAGYGDIRSIGSGNIGATNVMRTGDKKLAALTLLCDGLKGYIAVLVALRLAPEYYIPLAAGLIAVLAHVFPVWLNFKGGKGVATAIGTLLALHAVLGATVIILWLITFAASRTSSLSALSSFFITTMASAIYYRGNLDMSFYSAYIIIITLLLFFTHRANIERYIDGTELSWSKQA